MSNISSVSDLEALAGLEAAKRTLRGLFSRQSPVHAVLLYGDEGSGKTTLARLLAGYWLCTNPSEEGPCGECRVCLSFGRDACGDVCWVRPRGTSNLIRRMQICPVENAEIEGEPVISVQEFLRTRPIQGRAKVVILEGAERMNSDASNAFLKSLEEPEEHARFVLTTSEISQILPTIRSRCMAVPCELPGREQWVESGAASERWENVLSRRSPGLLERIRANAEVYKAIFELAEDLRSLPQSGSLAAAERFRKLVERLQKAEESNARGAGAVALRTLGAALASQTSSNRAVQRVAESHRRITGNANPALEFEALFAEILADNRSA